MATGPLSEGSSAPADRSEDASEAAFRAERAHFERRAAAAEVRAEKAEARAAALEEQVAHLYDEVAGLRAELDRRPPPDDPDHLAFFDDGGDADLAPGLSRDGSDPRLLSLALAAMSLVAALVAALALVNDNLMTPLGLGMVGIAVVLAVAAARFRVQPVEVSVTGGVVHIEHRGSTYRFDLRSDATQVEMTGRPGDSFWQVTFLRRHLDPFVVDAGMVDPETFVRQLRAYRPTL